MTTISTAPIPTNVLYYGRPNPLPEQIPLRAGSLTMIYENGDLRYIKLGDHEIVRRLYVAIRDRNWNTAPNLLSDLQLEVADDHFQISYTCVNRLDDIDFVWQGTLIGMTDGTITCRMAGEARSTFQRNRIGFCLLHPSAIAGAKARITHVNDAVEEQSFPVHIAPQLIVHGKPTPVDPFVEMKAIAHEIKDGIWAEIAFSGDTFELEDQRNWTDASYKTYGTPLHLPFPMTVEAGAKIEQHIVIQITEDQTEKQVQQLTLGNSQRPAAHPDVIHVVIGDKRTALPQIGLGLANHGKPLTAEELVRLTLLNLAHLRVDLHLHNTAYIESLRRATIEAQALDIPLEIALHLSANADQELAAFVPQLAETNPPLIRWLIFHNEEKTTTAPWIQLARHHLSSYAPHIPIGAGTNVYFTELNSKRPPVDTIDLVAYSINPQVHAFDNASLVETLAAQATTATSARQFCGELPLIVSPVTLQPRFNPNATGPEPTPEPGKLPSSVDARQMSLFGAGWTLGSIKHLAEAGEVASITYYETSGWRGVMETAQGSPLPDKFPSIPGAVFPLYHLLADVGEFSGGEVIASTSSEPLAVESLVLEKSGRRRVLLANLTAQPQRVRVEVPANEGAIRWLDERNVIEAMQEAADYRVAISDKGGNKQLSAPKSISLLPFGLVQIDV